MKPTILLLAIILLLTGCKGEKNENIKTANVEVETENNFSSEEFDYILPQPITLARVLKSAGLTYTANKTNPVKNKDSYILKPDQLLNFGVYSADLAYCIMNNKTQEARNYLDVIRDLGGSIGMDAVFSDKAILEKFESNLDNPEALEELVFDIQEKTDDFLADNDLRYLAAVQFAGAWVEGMYLGIDNVREKGSANIGNAIVDQMALLKNTVKGLKSYPNGDKRITLVANDLELILETYEGFESVKTAQEFDYYVTPKLSSAEFETLAKKIESVRFRIINPQ